MMRQDDFPAAVSVLSPDGRGPMLIVCEHAANVIPQQFEDLGLPENLHNSHIAWDPGALAVARGLSVFFDAPLVAGTLSRLLFDCNRPPDAVDAIPERSEGHRIPGNQGLRKTDRQARVRNIHDPFRDTLAGELARFPTTPVIVTVHSFTPVYFGTARDVEIGLIHDTDDRLARAMMGCATDHTDLTVALNDPYGPEDGVTHTLKTHALPVKAVNIMLEIRNDLIADAASQDQMAQMLGAWISAACTDFGVPFTQEMTS